MALPSGKSEGAFRTIGEVADELGVPQHVLRYWETKFPLLRPLQRAGNRRYYRPADVALARQIQRLLGEEGYTMRGAQQLLARPEAVPAKAVPTPEPAAVIAPPTRESGTLAAIRDALVQALDADLR